MSRSSQGQSGWRGVLTRLLWPPKARSTSAELGPSWYQPPPPPFAFRPPGHLVDGDLLLVEPNEQWIPQFLAACAHPRTAQLAPELTAVTADGLVTFLETAPQGRYPGDRHGRPPAYHFWLLQSGGTSPPLAGSVSLRVGDTPDLRQFIGHIGYNVFPARRGQHLAERAVRLLLPLARRHGLEGLWITANPENHASRRTCERLGAGLVETVAVPREHELYRRGERFKCRYWLSL